MDTRLEKLKRALESAVEDMSDEQMSRHLPGKWCAAEVLEHLYLTYTGTTKGFERLLESGQPTVMPASARQRFRTWRRSARSSDSGSVDRQAMEEISSRTWDASSQAASPAARSLDRQISL